MRPSLPARNRLLYLLLFAVIVAVALPTRSSAAQYMPLFVVLYVGDTLWAVAIYLGVAAVFSRRRTRDLALFVVISCWFVEFSQLYQADWINAIRNTRLGGLLLGFGFLWSDLVCYTVGVGMGVLLDLFIMRLAARRARAEVVPPEMT